MKRLIKLLTFFYETIYGDDDWDWFERSLEIKSMFSDLKILFWQSHGNYEKQKRILDLMDRVIKLHPYQ